MTMQTILEQDRERFLRALGQARTPAEASLAVRDECGRLLAAYNQEAVTDAERDYRMGDAVELRCGYYALLRAYNSEYVAKRFVR